MRSRKELLEDLVLLKGSVESLEKELSKFTWDSEFSLYSISIKDFTYVLEKALNEDIDFETLIRWANSIECRDDLEFKNDMMQELVFELANPEINGEITRERLQEIVNELQKQSPASQCLKNLAMNKCAKK